MTFVPRVALTAAEKHVQFERINSHIVEQRVKVEHAAAPAVRRLAHGIVVFHGIPPQPQLLTIEQRLYAELERTASFGFREAQREIRAQRSFHHGASAERVTAGYVFQDSGDYAVAAKNGLHGVRRLLERRAYLTAVAVADAARRAFYRSQDRSPVAVRVAVATVAMRTLHNTVLELIGETLNLGRTAGALDLANPPEYALRSEQLDQNTCGQCDREHGEIYQVDSSEFYAHMPPEACEGGGRCRGIYVFGDTAASVAPVEEAA